MKSSWKQNLLVGVSIGVAMATLLVVGVSMGVALGHIGNVDIRGDFENYEPALPTRILDRNGDLITEIFSDEKREIIPLGEIPNNLIYAVISREDSDFFEHNGVSFKQFFRALFNIVTGRYFSGFSTITMQVAGAHYADRTEITIARKLKEIWYAFMMEKALTKNEILEIYLNEVYFGHNCYGVEAASQFYFRHSARELTIAESAMLIIQLASPSKYSPINHPETARSRQQDVLVAMVENGYSSQEDADASFNEYWDNYDYERSNIASAYFDNDSKARYFSEYIRLQLNDSLYGAVDIYKDGYIVNTSLDLGYQEKAREVMDRAYTDINQRYRNNSSSKIGIVDSEYLPILELLSLTFDIPAMRTSGFSQKKEALKHFYEDMVPTLRVLSYLIGSPSLDRASRWGFEYLEGSSEKSVVEGALITVENNSGRILSMIGGSDFETKQYNRAVNALVQPGSSFKPLYYSAAISSRKLTPASKIVDAPIIFYDEASDVRYEPQNYLGDWNGSVRLREALANSLNVPALQVLETIGFETAIERASRMLGMEDQRDNTTLFPKSYTLGLGITAVAPINIAQAFAVFPSGGRKIDPIGILSIMDRRGNVILEPEKESLRETKNSVRDDQIMSPQEAFIMVDLLRSTVESGTLAGRRIGYNSVEGFNEVQERIQMAGKTGTTQNWQDAWTSGFSPYVTTVVWFGFDSPGISLGRNLTGATAAGPVWAEYMTAIHETLPDKEFNKPNTGLVTVKVCPVSGKLPTNLCPTTVEEIFLSGTEPRQSCDFHPFEAERDDEMLAKLQKALLMESVPSGEAFLRPTILLEEEEESSEVNPLLD